MECIWSETSPDRANMTWLPLPRGPDNAIAAKPKRAAAYYASRRMWRVKIEMSKSYRSVISAFPRGQGDAKKPARLSGGQYATKIACAVGGPLSNDTQPPHISDTSCATPKMPRAPQTVVRLPTDRAAKLMPRKEDFVEYRRLSAAYVTAMNEFRRAPSKHILSIHNPHYRAREGGKFRARRPISSGIPRAIFLRYVDPKPCANLPKRAHAPCPIGRQIAHSRLGILLMFTGFLAILLPKCICLRRTRMRPSRTHKESPLEIGVRDRSHRRGLAAPISSQPAHLLRKHTPGTA